MYLFVWHGANKQCLHQNELYSLEHDFLLKSLDPLSCYLCFRFLTKNHENSSFPLNFLSLHWWRFPVAKHVTRQVFIVPALAVNCNKKSVFHSSSFSLRLPPTSSSSFLMAHKVPLTLVKKRLCFGFPLSLCLSGENFFGIMEDFSFCRNNPRLWESPCELLWSCDIKWNDCFYTLVEKQRLQKTLFICFECKCI